MRILLDNCVDVRFGPLITGHVVTHAREMGWRELGNGSLLSRAEEAGFDVMVITDKNLRFQQNMAGRRISLITLSPRLTTLEFISPLADALLTMLDRGFSEASSIVVTPDG